MHTYKTYTEELKKPAWAPKGWVFGPVWSVLYVLIAISYITVFYKVGMGELGFSVALPFLLNLIVNFAYTPIQFGLRNNYLASVDILLVLATIIWEMITIFQFFPWITYIQIPYLLWVSFATILQLTITYLNR